jgi:hypothetical protein
MVFIEGRQQRALAAELAGTRVLWLYADRLRPLIRNVGASSSFLIVMVSVK